VATRKSNSKATTAVVTVSKQHRTEGAPKSPEAAKTAAVRMPRKNDLLIKRLIKMASDGLGGKPGTPTYADLIRLLQLQKDLGGEPVTKVTVEWVEPEEK
jgi:hypothetical protein